jgi:hypothetical protein
MKIAAAPLGPFETNAYLVVAENGKDCCCGSWGCFDGLFISVAMLAALGWSDKFEWSDEFESSSPKKNFGLLPPAFVETPPPPPLTAAVAFVGFIDEVETSGAAGVAVAWLEPPVCGRNGEACFAND